MPRRAPRTRRPASWHPPGVARRSSPQRRCPSRSGVEGALGTLPVILDTARREPRSCTTARGLMAGRSLRGEAAIVGVADAVSPTGELDTRGRVLEAADDPGGARRRRTDPRRRRRHLLLGPRRRDRRVPRPPPSVRRRHVRRGFELRGARRARRRRHRRGPVRGRGRGLRLDARARNRRLGQLPASFGPMGPDVGAEWETPVRDPHADDLATRSPPAGTWPQYGTTSEQLAADRGRHPAVGGAEPARPLPRARSPSTTCSRRPSTASPLHQLDCCLVTDGAGAYVMTSGRAGA